MSIKTSRNKVEGDNSPDTPTKVFIVHEMTCRNKKCPNFNKTVTEVKNELPLS